MASFSIIKEIACSHTVNSVTSYSYRYRDSCVTL